MINLIISTHGDMSKAILNLSKMVLGEFDNVGCITFMPGEGSEDLIRKYSDQIEKFSNTKETLFLVKNHQYNFEFNKLISKEGST